MKIRKLIIPLLLCAALFAAAGCTPKTENGGKTEYDDKEILKIETAVYGGYTLIDAAYTSYKRIFDFNDYTVSDEPFVEDKESVIEFLIKLNDQNTNDEYKAYLQSYFNTPRPVKSFSERQANGLLDAIKSRGIYTWGESYVSDRVDDASWHSVTIIFVDGTEKTSRFYCDYPDNFDKIVSAFNDKLGVGLWYDSSDDELDA